MAAADQRITVWDATRREWRSFEVVPQDYQYKAVCGNGLHQFASLQLYCACGATQCQGRVW